MPAKCSSGEADPGVNLERIEPTPCVLIVVETISGHGAPKDESSENADKKRLCDCESMRCGVA